MKNTTIYTILFLIVGGIACFIFFRYAYPYHLFHREQMLLFTYTAEQMAEYLKHPAVLSCLAGDFMTQFFHYSNIGPAVVAIIMSLLGLLTYVSCRKWTNVGIATVIAALIFGWETLRFCHISYPLAGTLSLIGSLSLFLLINKLKGKWSFLLGSLCGIILCYWWFGYGLFLFAFLSILSALTHQKNYIGAVLMTTAALLLPPIIAKSYLMMPSQAYIYPATIGWGMPDFESERILGLNTEDYFGNWDKINDLAYDGAPGKSISVCYNLANAMQEQLPDRLMNYYQPAALGLFMPIGEESTYLSTQLAGEVWFHLGDMTMAEHAAILSMIFSPQHKSARMVKRLAEINLINGDDAAARKYLYLLTKTIAYKQWAQDRMPGNESTEVKEWLKKKRTFLPQKDTIRLSSTDVARSLHLLLEANPNNRMARDYLLCFDLLMKDLPAFIKDYELYHPDEEPNRLYAEAWLIHLFQKRASGDEIKATGMNPAVIKEFNEYNYLHNQYGGNPSALENRFGKTYWFYFQFAQFQ